MKQCTTCKQMKDESEFYRRKQSVDGLNPQCKNCSLVQQKDYIRRKNAVKAALKADTRKDMNLRYHYNMSLGEYEDILRDQEGICAICGKNPDDFERAFAVDHDHETGKVRGILCPDCNRGLGGFHDNLELLEKAVEYIRKSA